MELDKLAIGKAIRSARMHSGYTQERLAEIIDVSPTYIRHLETGRRMPSIETLYSLASKLNLSVDEVFFPKNSSTSALRSKIVRGLNDCTAHELKIIYSMMEAMKNTDDA